MRAFDEMCLTPVEEMSPKAIRELRIRIGVVRGLALRGACREGSPSPVRPISLVAAVVAEAASHWAQICA